VSFTKRGGGGAVLTPCHAQPGDRSIVHPVEVARPNQHVRPIVTRRTIDIIKPVDKLVLVGSASSPLSPEPLSTRYGGVRHSGCQQHLGLGTSLAWLQCHDGSLKRYKAHWVCRVFTQWHGIECDETFNPVVKPTTVCTFLSMAVSQDSLVHQFDIKNVFLHDMLLEVAYVRNRTLTLIEREDDTRSWEIFLVYFSHSTTMPCPPRDWGYIFIGC
jgi:hypothetical protein